LLLALYLVLTFRNLRRQSAAHTAAPAEGSWTLRHGLLVLAGATVATALVSEILVHSLAQFGHALGLSEFFVAVVIVAIVGKRRRARRCDRHRPPRQHQPRCRDRRLVRRSGRGFVASP